MTSWNTALNLIIGGMAYYQRGLKDILQKMAEFYKRALGSKVLAIDNNWYYDFSEFSIDVIPLDMHQII